MARVARVVAPRVPHHVTQRGNRRQRTFFSEEDFRLYKVLLKEWCQFHCVEIWAYCLMPNHVHLVLVPPTEESLRLAVGEAHRRYTAKVNKRQGWTGCLWQGRFFSYPMDDSYLLRTVNYIEMNPVRAGICKDPDEYRWSSAADRINDVGDSVITPNIFTNFAKQQFRQIMLLSDEELEEIRIHERTGRPLGSESFVEELEKNLGRDLKPRKSGRPAKVSAL